MRIVGEDKDEQDNTALSPHLTCPEKAHVWLLHRREIRNLSEVAITLFSKQELHRYVGVGYPLCLPTPCP